MSNWQAEVQKGAKAKCNTAAFPKLFMFREVGWQVSLVVMSHPFPRTVAPPPYLPLFIKYSLKEDRRVDGIGLEDGLIGWLWKLLPGAAYENDTAAADDAGCCVSVSLRTKTLREIKGNMGQCKSKERDFKE
jgi:hypothetical protein